MKTRLISFVLVAITVGFTGLAQETNQPARPNPIDPRAMQMQKAVLKDRDVHQVEELPKQGVGMNAPIGCGTYGPLDGAVDTGNLEMLKFLLAHGAKPQGRELPRAASYGDPQTALDFVNVLLAAGVSPNATDHLIGSALGCAAYQGNHDLVVLLLAQPHVNVDVPDESGCTALMYAAQHGSVAIVDLLLKAGANPNLRNINRETAITFAEQGIETRRAIISKLQSLPK